MPIDPANAVLFLGAGASLPRPAGGPLFGEVRDACAARVGVPTAAWRAGDPRRELLDHVIPEVFHKVLTDAGYRFEEALADAVGAAPASAPNAVHRLAVRVLEAGGSVWTTNWDEWIERAHEQVAGRAARVAVHGADPPPAGTGAYGKLHGTAADPSTLLFRTSQVIRPLAEDWHRAIVDSCRGRALLVAGYGGADVDLYPALSEALSAARAAYWLEGDGYAAYANHAQAQYETWRFRLSRHDDPSRLPPDGRHLVWCGAGSTATDPSRGLLDAFGDTSAAGDAPPWRDRYDAVRRRIEAVQPEGSPVGRRLVVQAVVRERLADRRGAAFRHAAAAAVGTRRDRQQSLAALRNLVLLRAQPLRLVASRAYAAAARSGERRDFVLQHAGGTDHDPALAAAIADGTRDATIDAALNAAMSARWSGDLTAAERIARRQLDRALAQDLASAERDWPERVSRAVYELAQALVWQGRYYDADDVCRSGHMRVSGAKWTAWEFAMRATVRFAHGEYDTAEQHFARAETILRLEGFADFAVTLHTGRSASLRAAGQINDAEEHLDRARRTPRQGVGSLAAVAAERAELRVARGDLVGAAAHWRALARSPLPLWSGIALMRLAETGAGDESTAAAAAFEAASSAWGTVRIRALANGASDEEIARSAAPLGPAAVFAPGGPWLM